MEYLKKIKLNNKGLSLVEILVTVVIIALISAPIINSFMHAIQVNAKARTIQNGTSAAQDIAEYFKTMNIEALIALYENPATREVDAIGNWKSKGKEDGVEISYTEYDDDNGVYKFTGIPVQGADGESFVVDVTLDPAAYNKGTATKYPINEQELPVLSGLYSSDSVMLYRQYASPDETLVNLFRGKLGSNETYILNNINTYKERKKVKKSTVIDIDCTQYTQPDSTQSKYLYKIKVITTFEYNDSVTATVTDEVEKTYKENEIHNIYLICPIFDLYNISPDSDGNHKSSDKITIDFTYMGDKNEAKEMLFYVVEQDVSHVNPETGNIDNKDIKQIFDVNNLEIIYNFAENTNLPVKYNDYIKNIDNYKLKVYTNIGEGTTKNEYGLTYGSHHTGVSMYNMEVAVKLEGKKDVVATFNTAK